MRYRKGTGLWIVMALLALFLLPSGVWATDITLSPGYIAGTVRLGNFETTSISMNATGGGYGASNSFYNTSQYSMTVQGGSWDYLVRSSCGVKIPGSGNAYIQFSNRSLSVPAGQTVTNDYAFNAGIIRFRLNNSGDPFTSLYGSFSAMKPASTGQEQTYTTGSFNYPVPTTGYWDVPVVPNKQIAITASLYVGAQYGGANFSFQITPKDIAPGEIVEIPLSIKFVAPPPPPPPPPYDPLPTSDPDPNYITLVGSVLLNNVPSANFVKHVVDHLDPTDDEYYYSYNDVYTNPGNYRFNYGFNGSFSTALSVNTYFDSTIDSGLTWPYLNQLTFTSSGIKTIDLVNTAELVTGSVNIYGAVRNEDLNSYSVRIAGNQRIYDPVKGWTTQKTAGGSALLTRYNGSTKPTSARPYRLFLTEGLWAPIAWSASKTSSSPYYKRSTLEVHNDYQNYYDGYNFFNDPVRIVIGQTNEKDINYCTGSAIFRFRVAGGGKMSYPSIAGGGQHFNEAGNRDLVAHVEAFANAVKVDGPELELFGPPGDYSLYSIRVQAEDNTWITFPAMNLAFECDVKKTFDIPGPTLSVSSPVNELITNAAQATVSGTAFSSVPISGIKVNILAVPFTPTGSTTIPNQVAFSYQQTLFEGKNTIAVEATDSQGGRASDERSIYVDRWQPTVTIVTPKQGDSFLSGNNAIPVEVQGADQGYGFTLKVYLDGSLIYTGNGSGNDIVPVSIAYTGVIGPLAVGNHVVTATVTDKAGNSAAATTTIRAYSDQWPPVAEIIAPVNGAYFGNVQIPLQARASDQGSGFSMTVSLDSTVLHNANGPANLSQPATISYSQTLAPLAGGDHIIRVNASDSASQTASATHTIHVDPWAPTVTISKPESAQYAAPAAIPLQVQAADQGYGFNFKVYLDNILIHEATGGQNLTAPIAITFDQTKNLAVGVHEIKAVAVDLAGNSGTAVKTITVVDNMPPVLHGLTNQTIEATSLAGATASFNVTATDNIDPAPAVTCSAASGATFPLNQTTVTCTAKDASNNSVSGSFTIKVQDTTLPVLTVPADKTVEATGPQTPVAIGHATATDIFTPVTITNNAPATYGIGTTAVIWTAKDANNLPASKEQKITVQDTTAPVVTPPANITVEATGILTQVPIGISTATDAVGVVSLTNNAPAAGYPLGSTTVTWTAKDAAGNTGTGTQAITVVDTTPPALAVPANMVLEATSPAGATATFTITATDLVDPAPVITCSAASGSTLALGETTVTCMAKDFKNNSVAKIFTITVQDTTPPELTVPADVTVEATAPLTPVAIGQATATDIFPVTITSNAPATYGIGTSTVTWTAKDANNNPTSKDQRITVQDTTPPVVTPPANITVEATGPLTQVDIGIATATDAVGVVSITNNAPAAGYSLGTTTVTWTATDAAGNSGTAAQTITVVDTTPPALVVPANIVLEATSPAGAIATFTIAATDLVDPTPVITCSAASGSTFAFGETTVTCTAKDFKNNSVTKTFTITVQDTTPPELTVPTDVTVEATAPLTPVAIGQATATDIFPVNISNDAPAAYGVGTKIVNWTATDANKLTTSKPQNITVKDTTAPVLTPPANITVEATGTLTQVNIGTATATDAVGVVSITSNAPAAGYPLGTTTVTWTAKDAAGNTGTAVQTVTVIDTTPPSLEGLANKILEATSPSGATATFSVTAKDLVDPAPVVTCSAASGSTFALGETTVTCTAKDANGNSATGNFNITVRDTTPPVMTVPANITVLLNTPLTAPAVQAFLNGATATDIVDPTVTITSTAPEALNPVGAKQVTFTAVDDFGNKTTRTATIYVKYGCGSEFLPPVSLLKPFKLGSTIPVKFTLCDYYGSTVTSAVARLYLQRYSGNELVGEPIEVTSTSGADTGNYFRVGEGVYIYNLYTKDLSVGSYQIRVVLDDGAVNTIPLALKQ